MQLSPPSGSPTEIYAAGPSTIAALHISSDKVLAIFGCLLTESSIQVLGFGEASRESEAEPLNNFDNNSGLIKQALNQATDGKIEEIERIFVNLEHEIKFRIQNLTFLLPEPKKEIGRDDLRKLYTELQNAGDYPGYDLVYRETGYYSLDDIKGILNPIGMAGKTLSVEMRLLSFPSGVLSKLSHNCSLAGVAASRVDPSIISLAKAVLSQEDRENGVVLIHIGATEISLAIYSEGLLNYAGTVPVSTTNQESFKRVNDLVHRYAEKDNLLAGVVLAGELAADRSISQSVSSALALKCSVARKIEMNFEYPDAQIKSILELPKYLTCLGSLMSGIQNSAD